MAKKASRSVQRNNSQMRITVYYGYALFLLTLVGLIWTLFPWVQFISSSWSMYPDGNLTSVILLVSFVFTALAPPLVGYIAGDGATRSKSKLVHHFNGVLFGVLGVWLWVFLTILVTYVQQLSFVSIYSTFEQMLWSLGPAVLAAIVAIGLGVRYARVTKHQISLLDYRPYQVLLISAGLLSVLALAVAGALTVQQGADFVTLALTYLIVPLLFMLVATLVGYWVIGKAGGDAWERIARSLVAVGFAVITMTVVSQYAGYLAQLAEFIFYFVIVLTAGVWLSYLLLTRRALLKK